MLVYRYEKEGKGIYQCLDIRTEDTNEQYLVTKLLLEHDNNIHPEIFYDLGNPDNIDRTIFSGFKSIEQLNEWFAKDIREYVEKSGFKLITYDIPDDKILETNSGKQIGFRKRMKLIQLK